MKWIITFLAIVVCTIACEKSSMVNDASVSSKSEFTGKTTQSNELVGSWKLTEYFESDGMGGGQWKPATFNEVITFGADGSFSSTPTFPLYGSNYNRYAVKTPGIVTLFAPESPDGDQYRYTLESPTQLVFYPACREECTRRYVKQ